MKNNQPSPVTMVMLTPEQIAEIVHEAVARAVRAKDDVLLDKEAAAELLNVSTKTIERMVTAGAIRPTFRQPLRILRSELERSR
jgi:hypothetical protein